MKVLLLSMPDTAPVLMHESALHMPILGVASVGANVDERHDVYVVDLIRKRGKIRRYLTKRLLKIKPDIVGLSAMTMQYDTAIKVARLVKSLLPDAKIALGGYHATLMHDEIITSPESDIIDFIVRGEGEEAFAKLVNALENGDGFAAISSLTYKQNGSFTVNERGGNVDLTRVKPPIRDKRRLTWGYHAMHLKIEVMETSRGCPRNCSFCCMKHMYGRTFRTYPIERVIQEIDTIYYQKKTKVIFVADDNFVLDPKRVMKVCDAIKAQNYPNLLLTCQADCITMSRNEEMIKKMSEAGFKMLFLGIENGSSKNLAQMNKGNVAEISKKAVELCHKYGIVVFGGLIFGLPEDDEQGIIENYEFFKYLEADSPYCQLITPYPKTKMREDLIQQGLVTNLDNYKRYDGMWANVKTKYLSSEELQYLFWYHRQVTLGWWKPSKQYARMGSLWTGLWEHVFKPPIKYMRNRKIRKLGWRGLFEEEMRTQLKMNVFEDLEEFGD